MKGILGKVAAVAAAWLVLMLCVTAAFPQGRPNRPRPQPTSQQKGDLDRDRDRIRDKDGDQDQDRDRDRDRDRVSRPMTQQDRDAMMKQMQQNRNQLMVDGYRQNMLNFALNLRNRLEQGGNVDKGYAKSSVAEIKRNFKELEKRHNAHKKEMSVQMREQATEMIRMMEEHHERIRNTIRMLENDSGAPSPDARQMLMHVRQLEEQLRMMEQDRERNYTGGPAPADGAVVDIAFADM